MRLLSLKISILIGAKSIGLGSELSPKLKVFLTSFLKYGSLDGWGIWRNATETSESPYETVHKTAFADLPPDEKANYYEGWVSCNCQLGEECAPLAWR